MNSGTRIPLPGPFVVGIDLSSKAVDLVRVDENHDEAEWLSVPLVGRSAWDRTRQIGPNMPRATWWDDCYLCAIERPFSQSRNDPIRLVEGAVLACIPTSIHVWEVAPQTWKSHVGFKGRGKPDWLTPAFRGFTFRGGGDLGINDWPQDPFDALGVALYTRDTNAQGIAAQLGAA